MEMGTLVPVAFDSTRRVRPNRPRSRGSMLLLRLIPCLLASAPAPLPASPWRRFGTPLLANVEGTETRAPLPGAGPSVLRSGPRSAPPRGLVRAALPPLRPVPPDPRRLLTQGAAVLEAPFEAETLPRADDLARAAYGRPPPIMSMPPGQATARSPHSPPLSRSPAITMASTSSRPALGGDRRFLQEAHGIQTLSPLRGPLHEAFSDADLTLVARRRSRGLRCPRRSRRRHRLRHRGLPGPISTRSVSPAQKPPCPALFPERLEALVILQDGPRTDLYDPLYAPLALASLPRRGRLARRPPRHRGQPSGPAPVTAAAGLAAALGLRTDDPLAFLAGPRHPGRRRPPAGQRARCRKHRRLRSERRRASSSCILPTTSTHSCSAAPCGSTACTREDSRSGPDPRLYAIPEGPAPKPPAPGLSTGWKKNKGGKRAPPGAIPLEFAPGHPAPLPLATLRGCIWAAIPPPRPALPCAGSG